MPVEAFDPKEIGESALDTALPWDQIRSLRYRPLDTLEELSLIQNEKIKSFLEENEPKDDNEQILKENNELKEGLYKL